jgi:hypothetical protein
MALLRRRFPAGEDMSLQSLDTLLYRGGVRKSYIPQGIIINDTKVCAQYVCPTGAVASRINPMVKALKAIIMMILPGTRCKIHPVVIAAQSPLITTGENCAAARSGLTPLRFSRNCQK